MAVKNKRGRKSSQRKRPRRPEYGKWQKTKITRRNKTLRSHVPDTRVFNRSNLSAMLNRYGTVYVKPDFGRHGIGVVKIDKLRNGRYRLKTGRSRRSTQSFSRLYGTMRKRTSKRRYLIQRGIRLIGYRNRPFDIRVMIQKNLKRRRWKVNGMVGRVAAPGWIVTNYNRGLNGASIKSFPTLMSPHLSKKSIHRKQQELIRLGNLTGPLFNKAYPKLKEIGLDVVYDRNYKPWILEVNTTYPSAGLFNKIKNKSMYYRILKYKRQYKS